MSSLSFATQQITIYLGTLNLIGGVIGGILNIIVFLSLKTFRESSSAFYLTILSIVNVGELLAGQFTRILISGFNIDWTLTSLFYCKFRIYILQMCALISMTFICLAIIDQYLATCSRPRWRQWSNIKLAHRLSGIIILFWIVSNIPYLIYYSHVISSTTGRVTCANTNNAFDQYVNYVSAIALSRILPVCIVFLFGLLSLRNVHQLAHRALPLVRRELDKQLTVMVLLQVAVTFWTIAPYVVIYFLLRIPIITQNSVVVTQLQFASSTMSSIYYIYFASPFYIYVCASGRFRRQLKYVLYDIYLHQCERHGIFANHIAPQIK